MEYNITLCEREVLRIPWGKTAMFFYTTYCYITHYITITKLFTLNLQNIKM